MGRAPDVFSSSGLPEGMRSSLPSTANGLLVAVGVPGFPAVADRWLPWLVLDVKGDLENFTFVFFATEGCETHSLVAGIFGGMRGIRVSLS